MKIVIEIYKNNEKDPEVKISVPLNIFRIAGKLIPQNVAQEINKEGIDLNEIINNLEDPKVAGTLIEIEKKDKRIVISLVKTLALNG